MADATQREGEVEHKIGSRTPARNRLPFSRQDYVSAWTAGGVTVTG